MGQGRLIADTTVAGFLALAGEHTVLVRTPDAGRLHTLLAGPDVTIRTQDADALLVQGLTAEQIGRTAAADGIPVFELTNQHTSLEDAFMELTQDALEYRTSAATAVAS